MATDKPAKLTIEEEIENLKKQLADLLSGQVSAADLGRGGGGGDEGWEVNIPRLLDTFKNREYAPGGTGKVHFMGGSPYPQSRGQIQGGNLAALFGAGTNINDRAGNPMGAGLGALMDFIRRKRQQGQGGGGMM